MSCRRRIRFRIRTLLVAVTVVAMLITCVRLIPGGSAGGSLANGRLVVTFSDSQFLSSTYSTDTATIKTAGKTIFVEPTRLIVDGEHVANINGDASHIEVRVARGAVRFEADGERVQTGHVADVWKSQSAAPTGQR